MATYAQATVMPQTPQIQTQQMMARPPDSMYTAAPQKQMQAQVMPPQTTMPLPPPPDGQQPLPDINNVMGAGAVTPPPDTMPPPPTAMQPAPGQYSQWGDNPTQPNPPPDLTGGGADFKDTGGGSTERTPESNVYGGQQIAGATPSQADYGSVQGYADQAYAQARRRIDPQQEQAGRRMEQDLINKGIDPSSEQGKAMLDQQNRNFADQNNAATFGALQFGQGIQNQMSQQELANQQIASSMQQAMWGQNLGQRGLDITHELGLGKQDIDRYGIDASSQLGMAGLQNQQYGMDQQFQLGMGQLDYQRGMGEHQQMMDFANWDLGVDQYNQQNQMIQDSLYNQQYGNVPIPGFSAVNPYSPGNTMLGAGQTKWYSGSVEGGIGF